MLEPPGGDVGGGSEVVGALGSGPTAAFTPEMSLPTAEITGRALSAVSLLSPSVWS